MTKRIRGNGRVWKRTTGGWTIAYYANGAEHRESVARSLSKPVAAVTEQEAHALLRERLAAIGRGLPVTPEGARVTVHEALEHWYATLVEQKRRGLQPARSVKKTLDEHLGHYRVAQLTPTIIRTKYIAVRRADGITDGTIRRDLASLTGALNRLREEQRLAMVPYIPKPPAAAPRQGYPEPEVLARILPHIDGDVYRDAIAYADATARREGEVIGLLWTQVFLRDGEIRYPSTKNDDPLTVPIEGTVARVLERRAKDRRLECRYVFHDDGRPLCPKTLLRRFQVACAAAEAPIFLVHDLRRSGVRNLIAAGVSEHVAMSISGHRDRNVFRRYNIVSTTQQRAALQAAAVYTAARIEKVTS